MLTQGIQTDEFIVSPANGQRSFDKATVTVAGAVALPSGTVLGLIAATGKWIKHNNALANDAGGAGTAILRTALPGVNGDYVAAIVARDCEVDGAMLNGGAGPGTGAVADLATVGIIVR